MWLVDRMSPASAAVGDLTPGIPRHIPILNHFKDPLVLFYASLDLGVWLPGTEAGRMCTEGKSSEEPLARAFPEQSPRPVLRAARVDDKPRDRPYFSVLVFFILKRISLVPSEAT